MDRIFYLKASPRTGRAHSLAVAEAFLEAYRGQLVNALLKKQRRISPYVASQLGFSQQVTYNRTRQHGR